MSSPHPPCTSLHLNLASRDFTPSLAVASRPQQHHEPLPLFTRFARPFCSDILSTDERISSEFYSLVIKPSVVAMDAESSPSPTTPDDGSNDAVLPELTPRKIRSRAEASCFVQNINRPRKPPRSVSAPIAYKPNTTDCIHPDLLLVEPPVTPPRRSPHSRALRANQPLATGRSPARSLVAKTPRRTPTKAQLRTPELNKSRKAILETPRLLTKKEKNMQDYTPLKGQLMGHSRRTINSNMHWLEHNRRPRQQSKLIKLGDILPKPTQSIAHDTLMTAQPSPVPSFSSLFEDDDEALFTTAGAKREESELVPVPVNRRHTLDSQRSILQPKSRAQSAGASSISQVAGALSTELDSTTVDESVL